MIPDEMRRVGAAAGPGDGLPHGPLAGGARAGCARCSRAGTLDAVTFTSGSTVDELRLAARARRRSPASPGRVAVACIGPVTADAARAAGLPVDALAQEATIPALADALDGVFAARAAGVDRPPGSAMMCARAVLC